MGVWACFEARNDMAQSFLQDQTPKPRKLGGSGGWRTLKFDDLDHPEDWSEFYETEGSATGFDARNHVPKFQGDQRK